MGGWWLIRRARYCFRSTSREPAKRKKENHLVKRVCVCPCERERERERERVFQVYDVKAQLALISVCLNCDIAFFLMDLNLTGSNMTNCIVKLNSVTCPIIVALFQTRYIYVKEWKKQEKHTAGDKTRGRERYCNVLFQ